MTEKELFEIDDPYTRKFSELVRGVMYVREPSGFDSSAVSIRILKVLGPYVLDHNLGELTGESGGYVLSRNPDTVRAADIGFVRRDRLPDSGSVPRFFEGAPDLAIEVLSPGNRRPKMQEKIQQFLAAGTRLVWVFDMWARTVTVHRPGMPPQRIPNGGIVDGEDVVPGFQLDISQVWPGPSSS